MNTDALSRRPCQDCAYCERTKQNSRVQGKCDVVRKTRTRYQNWLIGIPSSQIAKAWSEDRHIGKIPKKFVNNQEKPKWEEISMESVSVKTLWAQWKRLELREARLPVDLVYGSLPVNSATSVPQYVEDLKDRMCKVHEAAREHIKSASLKEKSEYD